MPLLVNDSTDWDARVQEARRLAVQASDPGTKEWLGSLAAEYERLKALAAQRLATKKQG